MKFNEFVQEYKKMGKIPLYVVSGDEHFLKKQVLTEIKRRFISEGGTEQGLVELNGRDTVRNIGNKGTKSNDMRNTRGSILSFNDILDEVRTVSMFGKYKLVIVENDDNFLSRYQDRLLEYIKRPFKINCLVLDVPSIDKRTRLAKTLDNKQGVLVECNKLYDSPAPWEIERPEYDSELTRWIVMHAKNYNKTMNLKTAFSIFEKTGNNLAIIDKQIEVLSIYVGDKPEITTENIQELLGLSYRERLFDLLDIISTKDNILAIKAAKKMFDLGMENERKNITYDEKSIAVVIINSIHKRMKDIWKAVKILDKGGDKEDILGEISIGRPFVDKFIKQTQNFTGKEMPEKWGYMLEADLLCKTSRLPPAFIIEQLITKLCS